MVTLRDQYPLESKKPLKKTISNAFGSLFVFFLLFILLFIMVLTEHSQSNYYKISFGLGLWTVVYSFIFLFGAYVIIKYIYEIYYLRSYFYDLVGKNLIIRKGVFSKNEITLPLNRLQDVYVDQDVLDRLFGLYDVHVSSATAISGNLSHIDGLNKENSDAVKKVILSGIHQND